MTPDLNRALIAGLIKEFEAVLADPKHEVPDYGNAYNRLLFSLGIEVATPERKQQLIQEATDLKLTNHDLIAYVSKKMLNEWIKDLIAQEKHIKTFFNQPQS